MNCLNALYYKALLICFFIAPLSLISQDILTELPFLAKDNIVYYSYNSIKDNRVVNDFKKEYNAEVKFAKPANGILFDALEFNDSNSMVLMDSLPYSKSFTIIAWIKPYSYGESPNAMLVFEKCMSFYMNITSQDGRNNKTRGHMRCGGLFTSDDGSKGWEYINSVDSIMLNEWTHAAITFNLGKLKLYINGALVNEKEIRPALMRSDLPASWGAKYNPKIDGFDGWFHGKIDESFLFSRALTENEILEYYNYTSKIN